MVKVWLCKPAAGQVYPILALILRCIPGLPPSLYKLNLWLCSPSVLIVAWWLCFGNSPTVLCGTFPHKHSNVRLHIIVWHIRTGIFDICSMGVITSIFGIDAICSRTIGVSYTVRSFFVIVAIYSMFMISSWRYRYIMLVTWQFPDSFMPSASTYKLQARAACYCELFRCQYRQWLRCGCASLPQGRCIPY